MRGLILAGPRSVEFRADLPAPVIERPGDAIIEVALAGICGSDLHTYEEREPVGWGVIPGHEAAGRVIATGSGVVDFRVGDRVFLPFTTSCGRCAPCLRGLSARCETSRLFGWAPPVGTPPSAGAASPAAGGAGLQGTQAEYVRVPDADTTLLSLPAERSDAEGVLLGDNFTTGYFCARNGLSDARAGSPVVAVLGCGAVGLSALVCARHLGAGAVLAVDPVESRRATALRLGADLAASPDDASAALADLASRTPVRAAGADVVLEAVGSRASRSLALRLAAAGATLSSVGVATDDFGFSPADLYDGNLTWRVGRCPVRSLAPQVLGALADGLRIPVDDLAPESPIPLEEGPAAYEKFAARTGGGLKPLLAP